MNKKVVVKIPEEYIKDVMALSDYVEHETVYKDEVQNGYIRHANNKKRFHAIVIPTGIELHIDKTVGKKHIVVPYYEMLFIEGSRIKRFLKKIKPVENVMSKREKRKLKDEYAPNLMELQRNLKLQTKVSRLPFKERIVLFLKSVLK